MNRFIEKFRYLGLIGVFGLMVAAIAAYAWGIIKTIGAVVSIVSSYGADPYISVTLIEVVDSFLIATALFVFAVSTYELFIADLALPDWMIAHNLSELKEKLGGVIVLVMVVKFVEHLVEWKNPTDTLQFAVSIAVVSVALIALNRTNGKEKK